jgi:hypothetical protein
MCLGMIEEGHWRRLNPVAVDLPAATGMDRGVWLRIRRALRGLLVPDERGAPAVCIVCEPASRHDQALTHFDRIPVLTGERIGT